MHAAIGYLPAAIGRPAPVTTGGLTGLVYRGVRGVTRLVGQGVDRSLGLLHPLLSGDGVSGQREAVVAAMNGVLGDHLEATGNPLAIAMRFRLDGRALSLSRSALAARIPDASGRLIVLVHGLCMNDLQWRHAGHDHGQSLAAALDGTAVYLHYNTGRHISSNGRAFAALLEKLVKAWPVPVTEIALIGHSMGGLVTRSALDAAFGRKRLAWSQLPVRAIFLATPHQGAPLERAGHWADQVIGISPYSAPFVRLARVRSAGIQDLRYGNVRDADWRRGEDGVDGRRCTPLPAAVRAYAIAVTTQESGEGRDHAHLRGDGLVPVASAFGEDADPARDLHIPKSRRWLGYGLNHLQLLGDAGVCRRMEKWLASARS